MTSVPSTVHLPRLLAGLGMTPLGSPGPAHTDRPLPVVLDGRVIGHVSNNEKAKELANKLRTLKCMGREKVRMPYNINSCMCVDHYIFYRVVQVPSSLEVGLVPHMTDGQFPGVFLFTTPSRMMRPVLNLATGTQELIGSFEQVHTP